MTKKGTRKVMVILDCLGIRGQFALVNCVGLERVSRHDDGDTHINFIVVT